MSAGGRGQNQDRVALIVEFDGAEEIWLDVDQGLDLTTLELAMSQLFNSAGADRFWRLEDGEMMPVGAADPPEHEPIGQLLETGQLHRVRLSDDRPPVRGG